ncbi:unnamed protein product [Cylicostephanus goldi]|uniref:Uncharacterized protein n=1 Tax=Cylicostephanus goldi TaxID=71465 RepID=A0A3P6RK54_CYLGO|nr:unnamed protein product [Cylicostephanus goldi]
MNHELLPIFEPVEHSKSLTDMWSNAGSANFLGVMVQENPASIAWALAMNFNNDRNIRVVLARPQHPEVSKQLGHDANNRFMLFHRGESTPVWTSPSDAKWTDIQEKVMEFVTHVAAPAKAEKTPAVEPQAPAPSAEIDMSQYRVELADMKSTISYMLFQDSCDMFMMWLVSIDKESALFVQEIARQQVVEGEDLAGLKSWIHAVSKVSGSFGEFVKTVL